MFSTGFTSLSISLLFPLSIAFSVLMHDFLLINPSVNVFVFGDFDVYHKDWLTYSGGTGSPAELYHN